MTARQIASEYVSGGVGCLEAWLDLGLSQADLVALEKLAAENHLDADDLIEATRTCIAWAGAALESE